MLKRVVLIRHGEAESASTMVTDRDRKLTSHGKELLRSCYPTLLEPLRADVDDISVWASEAVRTQQTAEIICEVLGIDPARIEGSSTLTMQDTDGFMRELRTASGTVIAVGHVPMVAEAASEIGGRMRDMPRGKVICFDVPEGKLYRAKLAFMGCPK